MSRIRKRLEEYKAELERQTQYKAGLPGSALDIVNVLLNDLEEDEKENEWIPCSERLPENETNVIANFSSGTVTELRHGGKWDFPWNIRIFNQSNCGMETASRTIQGGMLDERNSF